MRSLWPFTRVPLKSSKLNATKSNMSKLSSRAGEWILFLCAMLLYGCDSDVQTAAIPGDSNHVHRRMLNLLEDIRSRAAREHLYFGKEVHIRMQEKLAAGHFLHKSHRAEHLGNQGRWNSITRRLPTWRSNT